MWKDQSFKSLSHRCCQTNEPKHQYSYDSLTL
jgi:hypothetical protein